MNNKHIDFNQRSIEFFLVGSAVSPIIGLATQSWEVFGSIVLVSVIGTLISAVIGNMFYTSKGDE